MTEQSALLKETEQEEVENEIAQEEGAGDTETPLEPENTVSIEGVADENLPEGEQKFDPKAFVKIDDPAVQAKFNDLYKQVKMSDARNQMLTKFLTEQQRQLDEVKSRFNQTDHAEAGRILNDRLKLARDAGDEAAADRIQQEIIDFRVDMKLNELKTRQLKQPTAVDPDGAFVERMAMETDAQGSPLRPWMDETHQDHERAVKIAAALADRYEAEYGYRDVPEIMRRLDQQMAKNKAPTKTPPQRRAPDPFSGGNLTNRRIDPKLKLSDTEKEIARKLGVSEKDYLANR